MSYCFYSCTSLDTAPVLTNATSVTSMYACFQDCTSFDQQVTIPSSVTNMSRCFMGCTSLDTAPVLTNATGVTSMYACFQDCTSFDQQVTIPSSVTDISYCFSGCTSFNQQVTIPSSVTNMSRCFRGCTSFNQQITVPGSVTNMSVCFYGCTSLTGLITIDAQLTSYGQVFTGTSPNIIVLTGASGQLNTIAGAYPNVYVYVLNTNLKAERDEENDPSDVDLEVTINRFRGEGDQLTSLTVYQDGVAMSPQPTWNVNSLIMIDSTVVLSATITVDELQSSEFRVVVADAYGSATSAIITVPTMYYTLDFLQGGREIVFGLKATEDDFYQELATEPVNWSTNWADYYIKDGKQYKNVTYELLPYAPLDWATDWTKYYIYSDGEYVHVTGSSAPIFEINTYYAEPLFTDNVYYVKKHDSLFKCNMDTAFNDMEPSEIDDFISDLDISGSPIELTQADWIVEQGVDGIWTWRKWQSGIAECWGDTGVISLTNYTTTFGGNGYGYTTSVTFPTNLFVSVPILTYSAYIGNGFGVTGTLTSSSLSNVSANIYAVGGTSGTKDTRWLIEAKGRWK